MNQQIVKAEAGLNKRDYPSVQSTIKACNEAMKLNPTDPVAQMVASGVARPLMPHIGTRPNVFYIDDLKWRG